MIIDNLSPFLIPYDKNGKYYRQPTNSVNKDKKPSDTTSNKPKSQTVRSTKSYDAQRNLGLGVFAVFLIGIIGGCVAIFKDVTKERPKSAEDIKIEQLRFCEDLIKENLKDPSSYRRLTSRDEQIRTGIIRYSGTNSFGGRVQESFKCF